jgi:uncharacterized protein (TIGR00369 family)
MDRLTELRRQFAAEPLATGFGATLDALSDGEAAVSYVAKDEHAIVVGIIQGGITTVIADYAGVYAAMSRIAAGHTPAKHIAIELLRPVRPGETITATARVVAETRASIVTAVDVRNENGAQKAVATVAFAKPKHP